MKKLHVISKPIKVSDVMTDDYYEEISDSWDLKATKFYDRRKRRQDTMTDIDMR